MSEFSLHACLMLIAFVATLAVTPKPHNDFPFSSAEEFLRFKAATQKQFMRCANEIEETVDWVRWGLICYFGGYRPQGPVTDL